MSGKASQEPLFIFKPDERTSVELNLLVLNRQAGEGYVGGECGKKGGEDSSIAVEVCDGMQHAALRCRLPHALHGSTCEMLRVAARLPCNLPFSGGMPSSAATRGGLEVWDVVLHPCRRADRAFPGAEMMGNSSVRLPTCTGIYSSCC